MNARLATSRERLAWQQWLKSSHAFSGQIDAPVWRFEEQYVLFAIQLNSLPKLRLWTDPDSDVPFFTFEIAPGIQTVARPFLGRPCRVRRKTTVQRLLTEVVVSAKAGRLWWGVESLKQRHWHTTILQIIPEVLTD